MYHSALVKERRSMKPLLIAAGVLAFQMLLFGVYFVFSTIMHRRSAGPMLAWLAVTVVVSLFSFMAVKAICHECLTFPSVAVCERRAGAIDTQIESNRIGGYIKERQFAGCVFYWHESNSGGD
jgi:hypothetical protein